MDAFWRVNPGRNAVVPSLYLLDFAREVLRVHGAARSSSAEPTNGQIRKMIAAWFGREQGHQIEDEVPDFVERMKRVYAAAQFVADRSATGAMECRWRDTKVTVPCDGDDVLGYWIASKPHLSSCATVHYFSGRWHDPENDEDDYSAPDFWMPLPKAPVRPMDRTSEGT